MSKTEELMKRCIVYDSYDNNQLPRYYVVDRIRYDFESGGWYSVIDLKKTNELKKYGTLEGAKKYALRLYEKYHKELGDDMDIRIRDEYIDNDKELKEFAVAELKKVLNVFDEAMSVSSRTHIPIDYYQVSNRVYQAIHRRLTELTKKKK